MTTRHRLLARLLICALLVLPLAFFPQLAFAGNNISVQVTCKIGVGVAGAEVKLFRVEANGDTHVVSDSRTDKKGVTHINNFASGTYELRVVCSGGGVFTYKFSTGGGVDFSHSYLFRCCPPPPGAPPTGSDGLIAIDDKPVTDDVTAGSRATVTSKVVTANGLQTVTFDTLQGRVIVNLPDDMRAGDTISGTVVAEPNGQTDEERAKNMSPIRGRKIKIVTNKPDGTSDANVEVPITASPSPFTITLPPNKPPSPTLPNVSRSNSGGLGISLTNTNGSLTVGPTQTVPIQMISLSLQSVAPITVQLPTIGQQGRPIEIIRSDGKQNITLNWTKVRSTVQDFEKNTENVSGGFGLIDGNPIAASPRKAVFVCPTNVTGPIEITLKEGDKETKGTFRNVGVNLSAPKTSLQKGESTELHVEVNGLEGLTKPVPLTLESHGVITMEGGSFQQFMIQPSQVNNGQYTTTRSATGVQTGVWGATATVVVQPLNICLQDDNNAQTVILINSFTGDYIFSCPGCSSAGQTGGATPPGKGTVTMKGCTITLEHNTTDRHVTAKIDQCTKTGSASVQTSSPKMKFTITDRNTTDNTCTCGPGCK
jgi:hypothetical protein